MRDKRLILLAALACLLVPALALFIVPAAAVASFACKYVLPALAIGMAFGINRMQDSSVNVSGSLPNGAAAITTNGIDLGHTPDEVWLADVEFQVDAPALTAAELPDTETMTYVLEHDENSDFSTVATLVDNAAVQTGAGGAGASGVTVNIRLPSTVGRYIRLKATNSGAGDASGKSATLRGLF